MIRTVPGGNVGPAGGSGWAVGAGDSATAWSSVPDRPRKSAAPTTATSTSSARPTTQPVRRPPSDGGSPGDSGAGTGAGGARTGEDRTATPGPAGVATSDHAAPSHHRTSPGVPSGSGYQPGGGAGWPGPVTAPPQDAGTPGYRRDLCPGGPVTAAPPEPDDAVVARLRSAGCVFAEDEARLLVAEAGSPARLESLVRRRVAGEPLEYLLGWAEFCGLRIAVAPGVFVPRRRSELLVEEAAALAPPSPVVVDLCCGSGAVAAALSTVLDHPEVHASDVDPRAVACARRNLRGGSVHTGDLFDALPTSLRGRVDIL